ncbi:hypothetical protein [uncultured Legionella sp.]|uniref:hypothetical protein n=1 Tax=uncultured Legionella sp. TaxID=210934 RepID=UPI00261C9F3D|nr:hypothetical protein [uncultured Legionella sp.]
MSQLFVPDFIKNRTLQLLLVLSTLFDLLLSGSLKHILVMLGLPYVTSVALYYLIGSKKRAIKPRISEQYRPISNQK